MTTSKTKSRSKAREEADSSATLWDDNVAVKGLVTDGPVERNKYLRMAIEFKRPKSTYSMHGECVELKAD